MTVAAVVCGVIAAVLHIFIFYLEVFAWSKPIARKIFGPQSSQELEITSFYAYNQGVYNLALAVVAGVGAAVVPVAAICGLSLIMAGCGSMTAAAVALGVKSARHRGAAIKQGLFPVCAVACAVLALLS